MNLEEEGNAMSDTPAAEDTVLVWAGPQHRKTLPPFPFVPASPEERLRLTQYGELCARMAVADKMTDQDNTLEPLACPRCGATNADDAGELCIGEDCPVQASDDFNEALRIYDAARAGGRGDGE